MLLAAALCAGIAHAEGAGTRTNTVTLERQVEAPAGVVTLGQLASVQAATAAEEARLRALPVAQLDRQAPPRQFARLELQRIVARLLGPDAPPLAWDGAQALVLAVRRPPPGALVVARRDTVTVASSVGPVRVEQPATALADGRAGDAIGARLPNGTIVRAQVRGPGHLDL